MAELSPLPTLHNRSQNFGSKRADIFGPGREDGSDYAPWLIVQYGNGQNDPCALEFSDEIIRRVNGYSARESRIAELEGALEKCWNLCIEFEAIIKGEINQDWGDFFGHAVEQWLDCKEKVPGLLLDAVSVPTVEEAEAIIAEAGIDFDAFSKRLDSDIASAMPNTAKEMGISGTSTGEVQPAVTSEKPFHCSFEAVDGRCPKECDVCRKYNHGPTATHKEKGS